MRFSNLCHRLVIRGRFFAARNAVFGSVCSFENCPDACVPSLSWQNRPHGVSRACLGKEIDLRSKTLESFFLSFLEQSNA